jgi:hypothetical protein
VTARLALNSSPQKRILDGRVVAFSKAKPKKESLVAVATASDSNRDEKHGNIATHIPEHYGLVESKQDSVRDKWCER